MKRKQVFACGLAVVLLLAFTTCGDDNDSGGGDGGGGDPTSWTAVTKSTFGTSRRIFAITYGNGKFVAGGDDGKMAYSVDGVTWTAGAKSTFDGDYILAIAYGNGKFVAGGGSG